MNDLERRVHTAIKECYQNLKERLNPFPRVNL